VSPTSADITERLLAGERGALARMISWAEDADSRFPQALAAVYGRVGQARRLGVTGPPGAGKSTLVNQLTGLIRGREQSVGVLAIDPSSPFSGGALLGDRIRMEERVGDVDVFIRSMASRGSHGGLARAAVDCCDLMDAFGFEHVLVETVGVGQAEYDVVSAADTVIVALCPGAGDGVQAMKAGILEVADVLVVNKSDQAGAERLQDDLRDAVHTSEVRRGSGWEVPVLACAAEHGEGVDGVLDAADRHWAWLAEGRLEAARSRHRLEQVKRVADELLDEELWGPRGWAARVERELSSGSTPYDVARAVAASILGDDGRAAPGTQSEGGDTA